MTHEEAVIVLPELLRGGLDSTVRSDVAAHLAGCEECRALSVTYDALAAALRRNGAELASGHPSSREIVAYAIEREALQPAEAGQVGAHLRECHACASEVEITRRAHEATRSGRLLPFDLGRGTAGLGPNARAALAAVAVLLVLVYPAYLGVARLPDAVRGADDLRAAKGSAEKEMIGLRSSLDRTRADLRASSGWSGPVDLNVLESPQRGGGETKVLRVRSGQPFLLLAVLPPLASSARPKDVYRFAIEGPGQKPLWSDEMTVAQVREHLRASGVVTFAIPVAQVPPGGYRILVTPHGAGRGPALLEVPFEVARSE